LARSIESCSDWIGGISLKARVNSSIIQKPYRHRPRPLPSLRIAAHTRIQMVDYASHSEKLGKGSGCQSLACIKFQNYVDNGSAQLTKTHASSIVHDSIEIIRRPSWRRAEPRWQRGDLAATTTNVALRLINGGWRVAPLRHFGRTNNDRPYMSTLPGMFAEVRPRVRSITRPVCIKPPLEGKKKKTLSLFYYAET
ncbi:hypothetical protein B296_00049420, partial [Ensete ventricosum]